MDGETVFIMVFAIVIAVLVASASYTAGQSNVKNHIKVYGCEKTISVYDIDMEKKK